MKGTNAELPTMAHTLLRPPPWHSTRLGPPWRAESWGSPAPLISAMIPNCVRRTMKATRPVFLDGFQMPGPPTSLLILARKILSC